ncbi:hypothetical protein [Microvirga solisilvae]|uniref:hypothetical protein n=1 Tax=Microvirga solisilvae TaxID=2919498 RepID=UPI001FAFA4C6|nr:hypothetical protein [Microvirga solisilvae]
MRVIYLARSASRHPLNTLLRLAMGIMTAAVLLVVAFFSLIVVLPLMLLGGLAFYAYLRRKRATMRPRADDGIIDAEYTVIERRE